MSTATSSPTSVPRHGSDTVTDGIRVIVSPSFVETESRLDEGVHLFRYGVTIRNEGTARVRLASRFWRIVDADGEERIAEGPGVVGQHPELGPGDSFEYSSYCPLPTAWGTMEGQLTFECDGRPLVAQVGRFYLVSE